MLSECKINEIVRIFKPEVVTCRLWRSKDECCYQNALP